MKITDFYQRTFQIKPKSTENFAFPQKRKDNTVIDRTSMGWKGGLVEFCIKKNGRPFRKSLPFIIFTCLKYNST